MKYFEDYNSSLSKRSVDLAHRGRPADSGRENSRSRTASKRILPEGNHGHVIIDGGKGVGKITRPGKALSHHTVTGFKIQVTLR